MEHGLTISMARVDDNAMNCLGDDRSQQAAQNKGDLSSHSVDDRGRGMVGKL